MTIEAAFFGTLGRDAEAKVSKTSGKTYLRLAVRVGDGDDSQWINTNCFDASAIEAADRLVKGARVYCEGSLKLDKWTAQDGTERHGLSCMARLTRLPQIGANKPQSAKRDGDAAPAPVQRAQPQRSPQHDDDLSDSVPF
jgi:single-stranded DNA-binding protein